MFAMLLIHGSATMFAKADRLLEKHPDAIDAFIVDYASNMFVKTNGSTVG